MDEVRYITMQREGPARYHSAPRWLFIAMLLYATSLIKFFWRDPVSTDVGPQGPIELALLGLAGAMLLIVFRRTYSRLFVPSSAKAFVVFGIVAAVSSAFSFYPLLSVVKSLVFLFVCCMALVASSAFHPELIIRKLYYAITIILLVGLIVKLAGHAPLLEVDEYSGRTTFTLYAWGAGVLSDISALTILMGLLLRDRPKIYCQLFLFTLNIAGCCRSSSALLIVALILIGVTSVRLAPQVLLVCVSLGFSVLLIAWTVIHVQGHRPTAVASAAEAFYGDKLDEDLLTLNGRTEVWGVAEPLISNCLVVGYGLDGARNILLAHTSWPAGQAHNALLELILGGGVPATLVFMIGWAGAVKRAWSSRRYLRIRAFGIYGYIALFGITAPNLTYLQCLAVFLIITVDSLLYADLWTRTRVSRPVAVEAMYAA